MVSSLKVIHGSITDLDVDCIVNAANDKLQHGGGVCGAIFKAAGAQELQAACNMYGGCPTGMAVITPGFKLKAQYIIHAVGPIWHGGKHNEEKLLYSCYQESMKLAMEYECHSIIPRGTTLAIPVHGSTDIKHDAITRAPGSFAQTLSGVSKLLAKKIPIEIRIVVSKLNAEDLNAIADLIITKLPTVYRVHFIGLEMLGNAIVNSDRVWLTYMEAFKASKSAIDNLITAGINVALYNFPLCQVDPAYWPICMQSISDYKQNYSDKCSNCTKRSVCGGVFASSMKFAENDLCPIEA